MSEKIYPMLLQQNDQDMEFLPVLPMGEDEMNEEERKGLPDNLPIIALRNTVLFPNVVLPITVSREKSITAITQANKKDKWIGVVAQKDGNFEDPGTDDMFHIGTLAKIVKMIKMPDGNITLFIMGKIRFEINTFTETEPYFKANITYKEDHFPKEDPNFDALVGSIKDYAEKIIQQTNTLPPEAAIMLRNIENYSFLVHYIATNINAKLLDKQSLLEEDDIRLRAEKLLNLLQSELQLAELKNEITNKTRGEIDKQQREYLSLIHI